MMAIFHRKRSLLQSQKLLRHERERQLTKVILVAVLFGGLLYGLAALSYSPKLTVQTVLVSGNSVVPTDGVLAIAQNALRGRVGLFFSQANIFWFPKEQIADTLRYSYSWIDTVSVERVDLTTIEVKIKERVPVAVWCGVSEESAVPCRLVDREGRFFAAAPEFSGAAYLRLYGPLTSASWRGAQFFSQDGLTHILDFAKALPTIGFQPTIASVTNVNSYDIFTDNGTRISVQTADSVQTIISNISLLTSKFPNLLYIDTRFGNKLFYKLK